MYFWAWEKSTEDLSLDWFDPWNAISESSLKWSLSTGPGEVLSTEPGETLSTEPGEALSTEPGEALSTAGYCVQAKTNVKSQNKFLTQTSLNLEEVCAEVTWQLSVLNSSKKSKDKDHFDSKLPN